MGQLVLPACWGAWGQQLRHCLPKVAAAETQVQHCSLNPSFSDDESRLHLKPTLLKKRVLVVLAHCCFPALRTGSALCSPAVAASG